MMASDRTIDLGLSGRTGMDLRAWVKITREGTIWDVAGVWAAGVENALKSLVRELSDRYLAGEIKNRQLAEECARQGTEIGQLKNRVSELFMEKANTAERLVRTAYELDDAVEEVARLKTQVASLQSGIDEPVSVKRLDEHEGSMHLGTPEWYQDLLRERDSLVADMKTFAAQVREMAKNLKVE